MKTHKVNLAELDQLFPLTAPPHHYSAIVIVAHCQPATTFWKTQTLRNSTSSARVRAHKENTVLGSLDSRNLFEKENHPFALKNISYLLIDAVLIWLGYWRL